MPSITAFDAGKRQRNASKAFSERQPANPQTRASSCVGCLLVGGRHPAMQDAGASIPNDKSGGGSSPLRRSTSNQQRRGPHDEGSLHVRAVYRQRVPALLPPKLEGINCRNFGADCEVASGAGACENSTSCATARGVAGPPRSKGVGPFVERGFPSAMVPKRDLQTCAVGWTCPEQSGERAKDSEKMSARTNDASTDGRGGGEIPWGLRPQGETDRAAGDLRGTSARRDSRPSLEGTRRRHHPGGPARLQTGSKH